MSSAGAKVTGNGGRGGRGGSNLWGTVADGLDGVGKGVGLLKSLGTMAGLGLAQAFARGGNRS